MIAAPKASRGEVLRKEFVSVSIWRFPIAEMKWRLAQAMGLQVIKLSFGGWREVNGKVYKETEVYEMFGFREDLESFEILVTSLELQMMRAENAWWQEHSRLYAHETKAGQHKARRGFMFGFASGAAAKYAEVNRKATADASKTDGVALVLRDKSLAIRDAFKDAYPSTRSVADRKSRGDAFAGSKGREAGRNADVGGTSVGGGSRKQLT